VSDFIIEHCGRLVLWQFEQEAQEKLPKVPLQPVPVVPTVTAAAPSAMGDHSTSPSTENPTASATAPSSLADLTVNSGPIILAAKKAAPRKKAAPKKKAAAKNVPAIRHTLEHTDAWVPPPPPAPFPSYQIPSFDARCIIYPGANYDPWWDMPQLIAQVNNPVAFVLRTADIQ